MAAWLVCLAYLSGYPAAKLRRAKRILDPGTLAVAMNNVIMKKYSLMAEAVMKEICEVFM